MLHLFCLEHVGELMESYLDEAALGRIALSCHFAIDLFCDKTELRYRSVLRIAIAASMPF